MTASVALVTVLVRLLASTAAASGTLSAGPAGLTFDNGMSDSCAEDVTGLCVARIEGDSLADARVDSYQRIRVVGVAVNDSEVEEHTGFSLLPDDAVRLRPSDVYIRHEVYTILIRHVGAREAPTPFPTVGIRADEEGISLIHPERDAALDLPLERERFVIGYGDPGPEEGPNERHGIRPLEDFNSTSTDERSETPENSPLCDVIPLAGMGPMSEAECVGAARDWSRTWADSTPDARIGLSFSQAALARDPTAFSQTGALSSRPPSSPDTPLRRAQPSGPWDPAPSPVHGPLPLTPTEARGQAPPPGERTPAGRAPAPLALRLATAAPPTSPAPAPSILLPATAFALAVVLAAFYARIRDRDDALGSARRQAIVAALSEDGPSTIAHLARRLGVDRTTVEHHARHLARTQVARMQKRGHLVVISLPDQVAPTGAGTARPPLRSMLLDLLASRGGAVTRAEIEGATPGVPKRTRNHALRELQAAGAIEIVLGQGAPVVRLRRANAA